jgi:hypothetical protein
MLKVEPAHQFCGTKVITSLTDRDYFELLPPRAIAQQALSSHLVRPTLAAPLIG